MISVNGGNEKKIEATQINKPALPYIYCLKNCYFGQISLYGIQNGLQVFPVLLY